ncbi:Receptor-like [Seminavis robusta]|uniref:Receptor-like n=1 Tax=Seminavis robusta TaxID=568900 RepID=A0A9N8EN61_9STRA|nr:Receptor-like [Seminavis robusta]|eukprot:Sro1268_g257740.1 Receptor-like (460) ;mRNA; f:2394-3938
MRDAVAAPKIETVLTFILGREYFVTVEDSGQGYDNDLTEFFLDARQKAFDWIVNQDPMQLEYDSSNLVQRFLLVLFYFQTTRHQPWKQCNPPATAQGSSSSNFCYRNHPVTGETTNGIWGDQWLTKSHECQWAGVVCETVESKEKTVAELSLYGNHLNGPLPWEITQLPELTDLRLSKNILSGVLPPGLLFLDSSPLRSLDLDGNKFIGTVPARWFESLNEGTAQLTSLAVSSNRLTGTIPTEVCLLPLNRLVLENNTLTGPLPREIVNQTSLTHLYLGKNDLTGTLPSEIGLLTNLQILDLNNAYISGPLPSEIGLPSLLYQIILSNTNMEGTIPEELYTTGSDLDVLLLDSCNLSGSISSSLGLLTNLKWLHLSNNNFYGPLPNEIEALTNLRHLLVNGNQFTGTVPESVCQNLYVEGEFSNKVVADCLPNPETGVPFIQCSCCTSCCDDTGVCLAN